MKYTRKKPPVITEGFHCFRHFNVHMSPVMQVGSYGVKVLIAIVFRELLSALDEAIITLWGQFTNAISFTCGSFVAVVSNDSECTDNGKGAEDNYRLLHKTVL